MSYNTMDHAAWVERNIAAGKRIDGRRRPRRNRYGQVVGFAAAPDALSLFQAQVMDILGIVGNGIYNAPINWDTVQWDDRYIAVTWKYSLSSWDSSGLTRLVLLSHMARIRVEIEPAGCVLRLVFWPRRPTGGTMDRHPGPQEAVDGLETAIPADHRIRQPRDDWAAEPQAGAA